MNRVDNSAFFADFNSLANLKTQAQKDPDAALEKVAQEFEAIFINMLFKNMRSANETIGGGLFDSSQTKQYTEMMDSQLAQSLAGSGGIGLANALVRQFQGQGVGASQSDDKGSESDFLAKLSTLDAQQVQAVAKRAAQELASVSLNTSSADDLVASVAAPDKTVSAKDIAFSDPDSFVASLWPHAQKVGEKLGVDPKAILAQAALETGWGKYPMARHDGTPSYNLFGIKADHRWSGDKAVVSTLEFRAGIPKQEKAAFRAYESFEQSFDDYANFLLSGDRYKNALRVGGDAASFAASLQQSGYATDPKYAEKISNILSSPWFKSL
ncbi:flagellar assembly peptidoglycan hydrolase FlgJ [Marinomonas piezotolerans]|uniref:Peptidoglycan hydrolase FlgJ n=1 Tax=Marinomonas piezotolerans TaxID=2213058 RepID=A0A370U8V7_9GAMM|nr:flagellar assembly peptidoglycan hydrolase FlgJ [Marinomonas piezotolerans]RDL44197.1 flagellar assembly peptidoglycan hydrolase FlgJ [Marinomonas piezotolerans]